MSLTTASQRVHRLGRRGLGVLLIIFLASAPLALAADGDVVTFKNHGHKSGVKHVALSRDGLRLLSVGDITFLQGQARPDAQDVGVNVWDVATGKKLRALATTESVTDVFISPDGKTGGWLEGYKGRLAVVNLDTGEQLQSIDLHYPRLRYAGALAMSSDGSVLAIGTRWIASDGAKKADDGVGIIQVFETASWKCLHTLEVGTKDVSEVLLSSDGKTLIATVSEGGILMWGLTDGKQLSIPGALDFTNPMFRMFDVCLSSDGSLIGGQALKEYLIVDIKTGALKQRIAQPKGLIALDMVFSGDGKLIFVAMKPGAIWIYSVETGKNIKRVTGVDATGVVDMSLSADGSCLATGGAYLKVYKTEPLLK